MNKELAVIRPLKPPTNLKALSNQLARASTPEQVLDFERKVSAYEAYMRKAGFSQGDLHQINEHRMRARWRLGKMLSAVERKAGPGRGKKNAGVPHSFKAFLEKLKLKRDAAVEYQHIGCLPKIALEKCFREAREDGELVTISWLINMARPYWHQEKRRQTHQRIVREAAEVGGGSPEKFGPFALIYADPPWVFETHTPDMTHRMPDDHYPTMTDQEIIDVEFFGKTLDGIAQEDCALFLWCTSSNLERALVVMSGWGFEYKTQAVWDKEMIGLGLIFRNQHEVLLYGSRGNPPKPIDLVSSVFRHRRTEHSVKPPQVRAALETMYPEFGKENRIEMFCRGQIEGWTCVGYEASNNSAKAVAR